MILVATTAEMQMLANKERCQGKTIALVPTMGALHQGHLELARKARNEADCVVVSIFVNPTQFGPTEDFNKYPRNLEKDTEFLDDEGLADYVFAPLSKEIYPFYENLTWIEVDRLDKNLCGRFRPEHFKGVVTVVTKLFNICKPDKAYFGLKDAQQFVIIKRMTEELRFNIKIIGVPTVREHDGLAMSSRNVYLSEHHRKQAVVLSKAVFAAREAVIGGEQLSTAIVEKMTQIINKAPDARIQYVEVHDAATLQPVNHITHKQEILAAVAVYFGDTRLIDNSFITAP